MKHVSEGKAGDHEELSDVLGRRLLTTILCIREFGDRVAGSCLRGMPAGAQFSQGLESLLVHIPGMRVVMLSNPAGAKGLLKSAIRGEGGSEAGNPAREALYT